ncbi:MAG TPA: PQQ-dependent sugar dehydrogenase [Roseiflexaceae bacterium]|nr:PQQ-dependent sugar dehydrogenase [Roseiflexaceae bacterium]
MRHLHAPLLLAAMLLAACAAPPAGRQAALFRGGPALLGPVAVDGLPHPLLLPDGFDASLFAKLPARTRFMAFSPGGVLHAALSEGDTDLVVALPDADHDGRADEVRVAADGLHRPHDVLFHQGALWVAQQDKVLRLTEPDARGYYRRHETVVGHLPIGGNHWSRTIGFGPDGGLYLSIGSSCNVCLEKDPRHAAITRYEPDGTRPRPFASGLRNAVGFVWNDRGELVATNNGRDGMGDDIPPDTIVVAHGGEDFGWPRCHAGRIPDPEFGQPGACAGVAQPAFELPAHSAPLGLAFYQGAMFPPEYHGDLLVALHGSFDRSTKVGYKVVRLRMRDGRPVAMEDFMAGWLVGDEAWGRPVDVAVGPDGAVYVSDDRFDAIYRVTYEEGDSG